MRWAALICVVALAGCGEAERAAAPQPTPDPRLTTPGRGELPRPLPPEPRFETQGDEVAVVDVEGLGGVRPRALNVASDAEVDDLQWSRWDASGARGSGTVRVLDCDPTCAQGGVTSARATVELAEPRRCPGGRFFSRASISVPGGRAPASYVRAPC